MENLTDTQLLLASIKIGISKEKILEILKTTGEFRILYIKFRESTKFNIEDLKTLVDASRKINIDDKKTLQTIEFLVNYDSKKLLMISTSIVNFKDLFENKI